MNKIKTPKYTNNELIKKYFEQTELFTDFEAIVNASASLNRELYVAGIADDMAGGLEAMIRFYNRCDEQDNIPVEERVPIKLFIDSPGGDLTGAYTIINAIELSKTLS